MTIGVEIMTIHKIVPIAHCDIFKENMMIPFKLRQLQGIVPITLEELWQFAKELLQFAEDGDNCLNPWKS